MDAGEALEIEQPRELSFAKCPESSSEKAKRELIEEFLLRGNGGIDIEQLRILARSEIGLVNDGLRQKLWPALAGVDATQLEPAPKLSDLQSHPEYHQVVLDVNRSLKRFPPGIPYQQRIALQDQLTVLILRVIKKYPALQYYQGYHDVAVTFLLVVGEERAFAVMEQLSTKDFAECMEQTMDATQKRLMFIWPLVEFENPQLYQFLQRSSVGTLFALPWYLTWFGHSLNSYKDVVRLYDYFLASPKYSPIFVTASIIIYRSDEILAEECDMAAIHCLLSKLPENLPFEELLKTADKLYHKYSLDAIGVRVEEMIQSDKQQQLQMEEKLMEKRKKYARNKPPPGKKVFHHWVTQMITPKSLLTTTAFSIILGICAYIFKNQYLPHSGIS